RDFYLAGTSQADALLVKLDSAGNRIWATYFGGVGHDAAQSVACDAAGNVYITGATQSVDSVASPGAHQVQNLGSADGFIAKFNGADGTRIWGTYYGGTATEQPYAIWCDYF